jgi:predicted RNase H-like nuclease (RuvC/YqgF family)
VEADLPVLHPRPCATDISSPAPGGIKFARGVSIETEHRTAKKNLAGFQRRNNTTRECSVFRAARFRLTTEDVKRLRREQVQGRKEKAARFTESVLGDSERAQEIRDESVEDYATRRKFDITNPTRRAMMARKTAEDYRAEVADLKAEISDLEQENESLQEQLDQIADIVGPDEDEQDEDDDAEGE